MKVPKHIAIIPDGNRRWAKREGKKPWDGHEAGINNFREIVDYCFELGIFQVTAYSISKENIDKRTKQEIEFLFKLYSKYLRELRDSDDIHERKVQVKFVGELSVFPKEVRVLMSQIEEATKDYKNHRLALCMNYGGKAEILRAVREMVQKGEKTVTEDEFERHLYTAGFPRLDLMIRTAERRISNFLLWQVAYSEIFFSPKLFPEFSQEDLLAAINQYNDTQRRFGK
jgi:undecaprenyl diphosphate synthase